MEVEGRRKASVASLRDGLNLSHIRAGAPQIPSPELSATPSRSRPPPPPLPPGPPRQPSSSDGRPSLPPRRPTVPTIDTKSVDLPPPPPLGDSDPPPSYSPNLPPRPKPPQLPPRLPPRAPSDPAPSRPRPPPPVKQKLFPGPPVKKTHQGPRSLPPLDAAVPVIPQTPWAPPKKGNSTIVPVRRPSAPLSQTSSILPPPSIPSGSISPRPLLQKGSAPTLRSPKDNAPPPPLPARRVTEIPPPKAQAIEQPQPSYRRNILFSGFGGKDGKLPSPPRSPQPITQTQPPPIPSATRPVINLASKPTSSSSLPAPSARPESFAPSRNRQLNNGICLKCRDFSHVDAHAARFPRHAYDDIGRLAFDLTAPFGSATDKARVIFTWLHHNVRYDVDAFFNNRVQPSTPASTLRTGLAVCEGFAGLFAAMAMKVGLDAIVVGGHGKGYGHSDSAAVPGSPSGHAWNAVRIDDDVWHLVDPCWGAGNVEPGKYNQVFAPEHFTMTPEEFRYKHYPENSEYQFCERPISFREYFLHKEDNPTIYSALTSEEFNFGRRSVEPNQKVLKAYTQYTFRLAGVCEHKPATTEWILMVNNGDGEECMMPDGRGGLVATVVTGAPSSKLDIRALSQFNGVSARGMTMDKWKNKRGANSWSYQGMCAWEVL
ncbi:hypothetical protein ABW20_dc0106868 [Dactylellina cionopaga]|nr:hypothetical protein ABW20_dc0106868 [Dactylellina cionopaga]